MSPRQFRRAVSLLLSVVLATGPVFGPLTQAFAEPSTTAATLSESSMEQTRTAPVELPDRGTPTTKHFLMPDGTYKAEISSRPFRYKSDGTWRDIDDTLMPVGNGVSRNAGGPAAIDIASSSSGRKPLRVSTDDWSVEFELLGGVVGQQLDIANRAMFANVLRDTDLHYEVDAGNLKETLVLKSVEAPTKYSFSVTATGLSLRRYGAGWAFFRPGERTPSLYLGDLFVEDSAATPAVAAEATMSATPTESGGIITYELPEAWLKDAARVFPVKVDPSTSITADRDTYMWSGNPTGTYGLSTDVHVGWPSSGSYYEAFVGFDIAAAGLPANAYIDSAALKLYLEANSTAMTMGVGTASGLWGEYTTWNARPGSTQLTTVNLGTGSDRTITVGGSAITEQVKTWYWDRFYNPGAVNNGFKLYRADSSWTRVTFHSRQDYSGGNPPRLDIGYCQPSVAISMDRASVHTDDTEIISATVAVDTGSAYGAVNEVRDVALWSDDGTFAPSFRWNGSTFLVDGNAQHVTPLMEQWTVTQNGDTKYITFKWKVKSSYPGNPQQTLHSQVLIGFGQRWAQVDDGPSVDILPAIVTPTATTQGLDWWTAPDRDNDGVADRLNDVARAGRGTVSLSWPNAGATTQGYKVMMFDGLVYREVGKTLGANSTSWSTEGMGIYPGDGAISSIPTGSADDMFRGAYTPGAATFEDEIDIPEIASSGLVVTDGTYLYTRTWWTLAGPTRWTKVGTGLNGTIKGHIYATIGKDFASKPALSAFYLDGVLYDSYATSASSIEGVWKGESSESTSVRTLSFSKPLLNRDTGAELTGASILSLMASDGERIYSVAYGLGTSYTGWRVRVYDRNGTWLHDRDIPAASYYTEGVLADEGALYFVEGGTASPKVTKVRLADYKIANQWALGQDDHVQGCYDASNRVFWLGQKENGSTISRYTGSGFDLRDNPSYLYARKGSGYYDRLNYWFRIMPYNAAGDATDSIFNCPARTPTLPNRTIGANDDVRHAEYRIGNLLHHEESAQLDRGSLELDVTDLSIASWGPQASLTRHYSSSTTAATSFAPGWRFNFEQRIDTSTVTFIDDSGDSHRFIYDPSAGAYFAPVGYWGTLTAESYGYKLAFKDRSHLEFSPAGVLTAEVDKNGNATWYTRVNGDVVVTAANGQSITVDLDAAGRALSATYATADGTRQVTYGSGSGYTGGSTATVNYYTGTSDAYDVVYTYGSSGTSNARLVELAVPGYEWAPSTGKVFVGFGYDSSSGRLNSWTIKPGDFWLTASGSIAYGSGQATVADSGKAGGADRGGLYTWNPTGTLAGSGSGATYEYDPFNEPSLERSALGKEIHRQRDARGNVLSEWDGDGHRATYVYDTYDQVVRETDPRGCTTYRTYSAAGNLTSEERQLNAAQRSHVGYTYNASGTVTAEARTLDATTTAETGYSDFALSGQPQRTSQVGVKLSAGGPSQTLVAEKHFDSFGNLLWERDASGKWLTKSKTYTVSGRLASSEIVTGTVTRYRYNKLGDVWETSTTAGADTADWTREVRDARGIRTDLGRLDESGTLQTAESSALDSRGNVTQITYDDPTGTSYAVFEYDTRDNPTKAWRPGSLWWQDNQATRKTYDAEDRVTVEILPGNTASQATTTTYAANGKISRVDNPDGTWVSYAYDDGDNVTTETRSSESGTVAKASTFDVGGRLVATTDESGDETRFAFDLADRQTIGGIEGRSGSQTVYNTAGWVLSKTDADGIVTKTTYDGAGRVLEVDVAGRRTTSSYDDTGRLAATAEPDGRTLNYAYDDFGRKTREWHVVDSSTTRDIRTAFDVFSRPTETSETGTALMRTTVYNGVSDKPLSSVVAYGDATSTIAFAGATGAESSRTVSAAGLTLNRTITRDAQDRPTQSTISGLGTSVTTYEPGGKIATQSGLGWAGAGAQYTYGSGGRKTAESLALAATTTVLSAAYGYTEEGRLETATIDGATSVFGYDSGGNVVSVKPAAQATTTLTYDSGNRLLSMGSTSFGWDTAHGWRTSMRRSGETSVTLDYTEAGRLSHYSDPNRSVEATYTYDAAGQRTSSVTRDGSAVTTVTYTSDGLTLLTLRAEASDGATWSLTYFSDEGGHPFAARYRSSTQTEQLIHLVTTDRGDVVELLDDSGSPLATYRYDAWGNPLASSANSTGAAEIAARQPLRYASYFWDAPTGLYYLSARYYDPTSMQFLTKDPAGADGEESAYQYCGGDPVDNVDPSGEWSLKLSLHWLKWYYYDSWGRSFYGHLVWHLRTGEGWTPSGCCDSNPYTYPIRCAVTGVHVTAALLASYAFTWVGSQFLFGTPRNPRTITAALLSGAQYAAGPSPRGWGDYLTQFKKQSWGLILKLRAWEKARGHYYTGTYRHKLSQ